jgi:hypothetical protein
MKILMPMFLLAFGVIAIASGEVDDSPGLQGIGMILIISGIFIAHRQRSTKIEKSQKSSMSEFLD